MTEQVKATNECPAEQEQRISINEDLTARRSSLVFKTRGMKETKEINDRRTFTGKFLIKDKHNKIRQINSADDLDEYKQLL